MIEQFNNIFYLIIFLLHFAGIGMYAYQTIVGTKVFLKKFGIDKSGAIMVRFAGSFMLALFFSTSDLKILSFQSFLIIFLFVGIITTFKLYISKNSSASVAAVPVQPEILL